MRLEYLTLGVYFVVLLGLGAVFARFNRGLSDFTRGGAQLTWWMVGTSLLMTGISAFTFTGNASAAFEAGPSLLVIYVANVLGFVVGAVWLGPWYRQTRAYTGADVVRARFGTGAEQFQVCLGLLLSPFGSAVQLWALAVFVSAVFGFPLLPVILVCGLVTVAYSASGGSWAVTASDFVQGVVLFGITVLVAALSLHAVGGVGGFVEQWSRPEMAEAFTMLKEPGAYPNDRYTWGWAAVVFLMQVIGQVHLSTAGRYLSVKDGREASRAAWLACVLMAFGSLVWFIPPMVGRFLYAEEILAAGIKDPATTAYAVVARHVLPNGLMGVLIAAMFSATMSSMDSGLNGQTSTIVRNLVPRIRERLGLPPLADTTNLRLCRLTCVGLGLVIIGMAAALSTQSRFVLFEAFLTLGSVIGAPIGLPLLAGVLFRRLPSWSFFFIFGVSLLPSVWSLLAEALGQPAWSVQKRGLHVLVAGLGAMAVAWIFRHRATAAHRERERVFFERMLTPVDFAREIGVDRDHVQALLLGRCVTLMGCLLCLFLLVPNSAVARLQLGALIGFTLGIGLLLWTHGRRGLARATPASPSLSPQPQPEPQPHDRTPLVLLRPPRP